jgi:hypothetical protein
MKKKLVHTALILFLAVAAWFIFTFIRVANQQLDASNRGHLYRHFFLVLEEFAQEQGKFPRTLDEIIDFESEIEHAGVAWPGFAEIVEERITPNFDVDPLVDSLESFIPDYKVQAEWGDTHCEFHWERIIEHIQGTP